ncbi:MAG: hypothetical protein H7246_04620 [Phycisphaerae bacterium]|nr:hypothetical protein [Saprospiraceae bacterium]
MNDPGHYNELPDLSGFFPVRISNIDNKHFVKFAKLPPEAFDNPFMEPDPMVRMGEKPGYDTKGFWLDPLLDHIIDSPHIPVGGFIFHLSRCGSTLVTQMMKTLDDLLVISEPPGISNILFQNELVSEQKSIVAKRFKALVLAHAHSLDFRKKKLFIKFQEFPIFHLDIIHEAFPDTPWIFLYREPLEIMASWFQDEADTGPFLMRLHQHKKPNYLAKKLQIYPSDVEQMPREEVAAKIIAQMIQVAMSNLGRHGLAIDYASLPRAFFSRIAPHFNLSLTGKQAQSILEVSKYYSKKKDGKIFMEDSADKRDAASREIKEAAIKWAHPQYELLKNLGI